MDLFKILKLPSNCYLCGCSVDNNVSSNESTILTRRNVTQLEINTSREGISPIICQYCHEHLPLSNQCCVNCGLPLTKPSSHLPEVYSDFDIPCGTCLTTTPAFDKMLSAFHYEAPISDFITQLKYSANFQVLPLLQNHLANKIGGIYLTQNQGVERPTANRKFDASKTNDPSLSEQSKKSVLPKLVIPVPLHPKRLKERGFNQSQLIGKSIAKTLNIPCSTKGVKRIVNTQAQSGLNSTERKRNIKNAFSVERSLPDHIAIVDDVVTTGMTVSELARQARKCGVKRIDVWCIARAYAK